MSSSILSQDEIKALLHKSNSVAPSEELQGFLGFVAQNMVSWLNSMSPEPLEIEGLYVERPGKSLGQDMSDEFFVVAGDLRDSEILMGMSATDADCLSAGFNRPAQEAMQMLSQAWFKEIAQLVKAPYQSFQVQAITMGELSQLILQMQSHAYLVRQLFKFRSERLEFFLLMQYDDNFEALVRSAMDAISLTQAQEMSKGKLLKGSKSSSPVQRAVFTPIDQMEQIEDEQAIALLQDIDLTVTVELGKTKLTLEEILDLKPQAVISLERHAGEPVDVYVNETWAAKGEVVVLEENFGVRILEIVPKSQRIQGA